MGLEEATVKYELSMTGMSSAVVSALAAEALKQHDYFSVHRDGDLEITPGVEPSILRSLADIATYLSVASDRTPSQILDDAKAELTD